MTSFRVTRRALYRRRLGIPAGRVRGLKVRAGPTARQRAGMPRFKKRDSALPTMNYPRQGFTLRDGQLTVAGGIGLRVVWSRPLPSAPSSVRVYRDALGR